MNNRLCVLLIIMRLYQPLWRTVVLRFGFFVFSFNLIRNITAGINNSELQFIREDSTGTEALKFFTVCFIVC
jgi:hypothetical protein